MKILIDLNNQKPNDSFCKFCKHRVTLFGNAEVTEYDFCLKLQLKENHCLEVPLTTVEQCSEFSY